MLELLIWWALPCGVACALIARNKGRSDKTWFFMGFFFGWFAVIFALLSENTRPLCLACKERIHKDATICPHCRTTLITATCT
jgi:hypothetical protein